ncbi:MAG: tetratricopeptide repeat protein [Phycisphaeraceae bacterium]|jgi:tetratricopeptide (TPR) repeat protein|nr:tetratricopeptide repeat protein [Phycisphaeraceae bacterium]
MTISDQQFLDVARPALETADARALADRVSRLWTPQEICPLLQHVRVDVRRVAAVTLGMVGDASVSNDLFEALHDPDEQVNEMAEHALWSIWFRAGGHKASRLFSHGVKLLGAERYESAIVFFQAAIKLDPTFAEAYNQCAVAHFFLAQWEQAIELSQRVIEYVPDHFGALAGLGHCFAETGEFDQALKYYRTALQVNPRMQAIRAMICRLESARLDDANEASGDFLVDSMAW